ncbi:uncharacterized protein LOC107419794 isoform X2 [Ziziphus jujuba]|uniref:Uncharacterized protein LOC107419794 isoform X2 n=1 Tax=Ziziphus jujuba TaxID=326968 RepID=A0ABM3INS5_ZIZJJ|nr:uncharacterized protein LOC107419794 isoform X2 [Ziziphus jujuba]
MGNRVDKVFTTAAYDHVVKELREKIDTKMWSAQLEVRPDARKWRATPIANYNKLVLLFGKEKSDGVADAEGEIHVGNGGNLNCIDHVLSQNEVILTLEDLNGMNDGDQSPTSLEANSQIDSQAPSLSATSLKGKKRKAPRNFDFEREFANIREAIKNVAVAIREGNAVAERGRPHVYSEQEVFAELVNIGVDSQIRYRAYTFLISNAGRVRAFFGCPTDERKEFLLQMMYSPQDC